MSKRRRHKRRSRKSEPAILYGLIGVVLISGVALGAWAYNKTQSAQKPDKNHCYNLADRAHHIILGDVTASWTGDAKRDMRNAFEEIWRDYLSFNDRFTFFAIAKKSTGSIPKPLFSVCKPASAPEDLEKIGAATAIPAYLEKQQNKIYEKQIEAEIDNFMAGSTPSVGSPIMEMIAAISRRVDFTRNAHNLTITIASDMLQNNHDISFCIKKGDMPSFHRFSMLPVYEGLKPNDLTGIKVRILLRKSHYGHPPLLYCNENELAKFWKDYFIANGVKANDINFVRIQ